MCIRWEVDWTSEMDLFCLGMWIVRLKWAGMIVTGGCGYVLARRIR
jgi:hypothetical protein